MRFWSVGLLVGWLVGWVVGLFVGWLVGLVVGLLVGWWVGWLAGWLVGLFVGWLVGWFDPVCTQGSAAHLNVLYQDPGTLSAALPGR